METIDLSRLTKNDFDRVEHRLYSLKADGFGVSRSDTFFSANMHVDPGWHVVLVLHFRTGKSEIRIYHYGNDYFNGSYPLEQTPTILEDLVRHFDAKENIKVLQPHYAKLLEVVHIAPSKEDFYDDASDYQDDEPTDFGDASNYDEALVQRIKEILK